MIEVKKKPTYDYFVNVVRNNFKGMEITNLELDHLKQIFDKVSRDDLVQAYNYAQKHKSFNPVSTIIRELRKIKPSINDYIQQQNVTYNWQGKRVEHGTDWDKKFAESPPKKTSDKELADLHQWFVNYDAVTSPELNLHYVKIDDESDKFFKELQEECSPKIKQKTSTEPIKASKWYKSLYYSITGEHYQEES